MPKLLNLKKTKVVYGIKVVETGEYVVRLSGSQYSCRLSQEEVTTFVSKKAAVNMLYVCLKMKHVDSLPLNSADQLQILEIEATAKATVHAYHRHKLKTFSAVHP